MSNLNSILIYYLEELLLSENNLLLVRDGKFRNIDLPVGTYYYIIDPKNGRKQITGSVTIIR
ncbi:MAG: hypothetical protein ABI390_03205 [Daejeonella sp.]